MCSEMVRILNSPGLEMKVWRRTLGIGEGPETRSFIMWKTERCRVFSVIGRADWSIRKI